MKLKVSGRVIYDYFFFFFEVVFLFVVFPVFLFVVFFLLLDLRGILHHEPKFCTYSIFKIY